MNNQKNLQGNLRIAVELMGNSIDRLDIKSERIYGNFLAQTYYYVSHSTRLLAFAAGLLKPIDEKTFRRFIKHISEESSHEILAEKDLNDLSLSPIEFRHMEETRCLWETQYYKIMHESPLAFMGYILALEAFACEYFPALLEKLEAHYGGKAIKFVKLHAEEDPDHVEKAIQVIESLDQASQELVLINLHQTAKMYTNMINEIQQDIDLLSAPANLLLGKNESEFIDKSISS